MQSLNLELRPVALEPVDEEWLPGLKPYAYQSRVYRQVKGALEERKTLCLFIVTPTGSGKTLASYAYSILHGEPAFGVYPTNELIRDQEQGLRPWWDSPGTSYLLRVDSAQLDEWQVKLDLERHSETLERLMRWEATILTNPDILFHIFFGLYQGPPGIAQRLFTLLGQYRLFVFDEFHLYNVKQVADTAFLVGVLHLLRPGRVFLFASATPDSPLLPYLRDRLGIPVEVISAQPFSSPHARVVSHPLRLTVLPADLHRWRGEEALGEYFPELEGFLEKYPAARIIAILDSVAAAMRLAKQFRETWPEKVGEVHGFSSAEEREGALRRPFTVGTSTIEVGIDLKGPAEKDVLIFEARTSAQFIQRLGRIARHQKSLTIPNWAIALVPEYVYHFLTSQLQEGQTVSRADLYALVEEAYQKPEDFARYLQVHAAAEFQEAVAQAQSLFQPDDRPRVQEGMAEVVHALTGKTAGQAWAARYRYREEGIIWPLLAFRGNNFEVAIIDELGSDVGFPVKRYHLMFLLRGGQFEELEPAEFWERLNAYAARWPEEVAREKRYMDLIGRASKDLLGVYGYFRLTGLLDRARRVWFEIDEEVVSGKKGRVGVISGLVVETDPPVRLNRLNRHLRRKEMVAWFVDRPPIAIRLGRSLPPLFEVYELYVRRVGGARSGPWSIAFNQNAFFLDSLGWWREQREGEAIIL
ncbi:MAG: type I-D CRISPR-associated helicase Cas3' [Anaerolineae bacterium]